VKGDTTVEQNETFAVTLSNPTNGATLTTASATGTITNDDGANIIGTNGNDTITPGFISPGVIGGFPTSANDTLNGGLGADILIGGGDSDILIGGAGADTITGGLGADSFRFQFLSEGVDVITDFSWQEGDKIQISAAGFGATSINQVSYNSLTGGLLYDPSGLVGPTQFATLGNKPAGFSVNLDVALV
jgi:Ca2+-binding RTX toxin-like protein